MSAQRASLPFEVGIYLGPAAFVIACLAALWWGFAASVLWGWFAVPVFGLPPVNVPTATGLLLIFRLAQGAAPYQRDAGVEWLVSLALNPAISLLFGWALKGWSA